MALPYIVDEVFEKVNYSQLGFQRGEYECCKFINCDLSNSDLSGSTFVDCLFEGCNLSMVKVVSTALRDVSFSNCKMLGVQFSACNPFGLTLSFSNSILNHSSFYKLKLQKSIYRKLKLIEVDLSEVDFSNSLFDECDFSGANFDNTILEKCDFRTSFNYIIDPERNRVKNAKFSLMGVPGLLSKYGIDIQ